jgi:hypothetical protein
MASCISARSPKRENDVKPGDQVVLDLRIDPGEGTKVSIRGADRAVGAT